tara:strand:- start:137 stop:1561 length:1425 start_codon:yes stop_codon:yes gene_type:complete
MRLLYTAIACLISVSVFSQENPDTWIEIKVTCFGDNNAFSTFVIQDDLGQNIINEFNSLSGPHYINHNISGIARFSAYKLLSGQYSIIFNVDSQNETGGLTSVTINNACDSSIINETFNLNDEHEFSFYVQTCDDLTYIPDNNLESIIESEFPFAANGIEHDNYVNTIGLVNPGNDFVAISNDNDFGPIFDLNGIQNIILTNYYTLNINNTFTSGELDLSNCKLFDSSISISNNQYISSIRLPENYYINQISVSSNENLENIYMGDSLTFKNMSVGGSGYYEYGLCNVEVSGFVSSNSFNPWTSSNPQITISSKLIDLSGLLSAPYQTPLNLSAFMIDMRNNISIYNWGDQFGNVMIGPFIDYEWIFSNLGITPNVCVNLNNQSDISFCENTDGWPNVFMWDGLVQGEINYELECFTDNFDCDFSNSIKPLITSSKRQLVKKVDALGREANHMTNQILFHIYDDGSVEKKFIVE